MSTIKISELNSFPAALTTDDFFPIDKSSSLLTYRATLGQLQSLLSTGSFTGSLIGTLTGTASWANNAISSSYAITSSYSANSTSASYAVTASYVSGSGGTLTGTGTAQYFAKWSNTNVLTDADFYYNTSNTSNVSTKNLIVFKNTPQLIVTGSGQAFAALYSTYNSNLYLQSATTASDGLIITCTADGNYYSSPGWGRGGIDFLSYTSSNNFTYGGKDYSGDSLDGGQVRLLRIRSNGWYFWPLGGVQSVSRDGTVNIGVDSGTENHDTRLKIAVFSGSSAAPQTVDHLQKAIEVTYGSGSGEWPSTFCVSSSGTIISAGALYLNKNISHTSETYVNASIGSYPTGIQLSATDNRMKYLQFSDNMTASVEMQLGQTFEVIVNQAGSPTTASIHFTGSFLSASGAYFAAPIVWPNNIHPQNYTGSANTASLFRFICVGNGGNGPGGNNILYPHQKVIYGKLVDLQYYY